MQLSAAMPEATVSDDFYVRFEAIDPATGEPVTGITVQNAALFVDEDTGDGAEPLGGPQMFIPGPGA